MRQDCHVESMPSPSIEACLKLWCENLGDEFAKRVERMGEQAFEPHLLHVRIALQDMTHWHGSKKVRRYIVSTSRRPPSCVENSLGTPTGLHIIEEAIGDGEPIGMVFRGRRAIGQRYFELSEEERVPCLVTTRILRLRGLEPGINTGPGCDSYERYIYIHGTNHEERLGNPQSAGCIVLGNEAMLALYESVPVKTLVWIGMK